MKQLIVSREYIIDGWGNRGVFISEELHAMDSGAILYKFTFLPVTSRPDLLPYRLQHGFIVFGSFNRGLVNDLERLNGSKSIHTAHSS